MKKSFKFFAFALAAMSLSMFAACGGEEGGADAPVSEPTTVLSENFEAGLPTDWIYKDADGDGYNWCQNEAWTGHNGSALCAASQSYDNTYGVLTPDNWMITKTIKIPGNNFNVKWFAAGQDASYSQEHYAVYVGTVANGVFTQTATLLEETLPAGKGQGAWRDRSASLADYGGQDVAIAFRHYNVEDMFVLLIDDFEVSNL